MNSRNRERQLAFYESMYRIRTVETTLSQLFAKGEIPGFIHLSTGQEAVAVGVADTLRPGDTFVTTHRGHGHAIASRTDLKKFVAEIMGKQTGFCRGRSGSMHVADASIGMLGANGIVGAPIPIAVGSALAHRQHDSGQLAVGFFGDGALAEGVLHESLNIAALWRLPVLFVCENNGWSEFSRAQDQLRFELTKLAQAYAIDAIQTDGNDVELVASVVEEISGPVRTGFGPAIVECLTTRHSGHFEGDPQRYRDDEDISSSRKDDPVARLRERLFEAGVTAETTRSIEHKVRTEVAEAVATARAESCEDFSVARKQVYAGR